MKGDMELYSKLSHDITQVIEKSTYCRKASIDEFYLDITGMDRFHGCYQWTNELSQSITKKQDCQVLRYLLIRRFRKLEPANQNQ
jgi:DNA polymerase-4